MIARGRWITKQCPKCRKRTVITKDSRPTQHWRRRRKVCLNCGERGTTIELPVEPGLKPMIERVRLQGGFQTLITGVPLALVAETHRK